MDFTFLMEEISRGFTNFTWGNGVMILIGVILITLAVVKEYEPVLLLPIGFGCIMANIGMSADVGFMKVIYDAGIKTELFPLLIFVGVGAMIDFSPLISQTGMLPCLRGGCCSDLCRIARSALMIIQRVSAGSITSSTYPALAAAYGVRYR